MNKVILMGRLTKDVELKSTPSGISAASFSIAVNRRFAKEGQQQADLPMLMYRKKIYLFDGRSKRQ